jgi:hypothetical protein
MSHSKLEALALDLHRSGVSQRRIARDLGLTIYRVRKILTPDFTEKQRALQARFYAKPGFSRRQYLRGQARLQAIEEGVPYEEVYIRFGVPSIKRGPRS